MSMILFTFLIICASAIAQEVKVPVTIYYESLCPDSAKFITDQFFPVYNSSLNKFLDVSLVPYGKSSFKYNNDKYEFTCHHGANECAGNKVHSCGIEILKSDKNKTVSYINCLMMNAKAEPFPTKMCGEKVGLMPDMIDSITKCAEGEQGDELLAGFANKTNEFQNPLKSVPSVTFNNKVNNDNSKATTYFKAALCGQIPEKLRPTDCPTGNDASKLSMISFVPIITAIVLSRL